MRDDGPEDDREKHCIMHETEVDKCPTTLMKIKKNTWHETQGRKRYSLVTQPVYYISRHYSE